MNEITRILNKGVLKKEFLETEERCDYKVTSEMKKIWLVELDLLLELIRVCDKYKIKYYPIGGTLLGVIRHKGFVPWDDDIDIAIPRKDYDFLSKIAAKEFQHPYFFQDENSENGILAGHAKLRNSNTTCICPGNIHEKRGQYTFNAGIFIDIFPLDNIPDNKDEYDSWIEQLTCIGKLFWTIRKYIFRHYPENDPLIDIETKYINHNKIMRLYDDALSLYKNIQTKKSVIYSLYCKDKRWCFRNSCFEQPQVMKFENIDLPVPNGWEKILKKLYKDWQIMKKLGSVHAPIQGAFYDVNNPYSKYMDKNGIKKELIIDKIKFPEKGRKYF